MSTTYPQTLTVTDWDDDRVEEFDVRSVYVERCWAHLLSPTGLLALRVCADLLDTNATRSLKIDSVQVAELIGVGVPTLFRSFARMQHPRFVSQPRPGEVAVRTRLTALSGTQLQRAPVLAVVFHHRLTADARAVS